MLALLYTTIVVVLLIGIFIVAAESWLLDGFSIGDCVEGIFELIKDILT